MRIKLSLKEKEVSLVLLDNEQIIDREKWIDQNDILEQFFPVIDEMLNRNNINISDIKDFKLETNIPSGYTTARIAKTIIKTLNFAQKS
jgi:tRNA A37 threonylcarbamoyladenosine modification protein TsaB